MNQVRSLLGILNLAIVISNLLIKKTVDLIRFSVDISFILNCKPETRSQNHRTRFYWQIGILQMLSDFYELRRFNYNIKGFLEQTETKNNIIKIESHKKVEVKRFSMN